MNEENANKVEKELLRIVTTSQTKDQVIEALEKMIEEIKTVYDYYGPANEYLLTAYDAGYLERPATALAYQEYLEEKIAEDVLFLDE